MWRGVRWKERTDREVPLLRPGLGRPGPAPGAYVRRTQYERTMTKLCGDFWRHDMAVCKDGYKRCSRCGRLTNRNVPDAVRFWEMVDKNGPGGCWLWTGALNTCGYGEFRTTAQKQYRAHRYSRLLAGRKLPDFSKNLTLDHLCRVRACINPDHIEAVTQRENLKRSPLTPAGRKRCRRGHDLTLPTSWYRYSKGRRRCKLCIPICRSEWMASRAI